MVKHPIVLHPRLATTSILPAAASTASLLLHQQIAGNRLRSEPAGNGKFQWLEAILDSPEQITS